jgi:predicted patatin/cPLA2 family phospholipase
MKDVGLVLEGGALRGVFTAGVLDYLIEKDIEFPYLVGASVGVSNMLGFISRQGGYAKRLMMQKDSSKRFFGINQLLKSSKIIDLDKVFFEYPHKENPYDFKAYFNSKVIGEMVVTNCITGMPEYISEANNANDLSLISKASASIALFSSTVTINNQPYLDGGIADSIPLFRAISKGFKKNIVILTRNIGDYATLNTYQKMIFEKFYSKYPKLVKTIVDRPKKYYEVIQMIERLEAKKEVFVIRPEIRTVRRFEADYDKLEKLYNHGYETMENQFEALLTFINE